MRKKTLLRQLLRALLVCCIMLLPLVGGLPPRASAADPLVFVVNTFDDVPDMSPNLICAAGLPWGPKPCSLRAAIYEADYALSLGYDVIIEVPEGTYKLTLTDTSQADPFQGDLDLGSFAPVAGHVIHIRGLGPTRSVIDADRHSRVLEVRNYEYVVQIDNLEFNNGLDVGDQNNSPAGGGIYFQEGALYLRNVAFRGNEALWPSAQSTSSTGGGLFVGRAELVMTDCHFYGNAAFYAAAFFSGPNYSITWVRDSVAHGNVGAFGGSVIRSTGSLYLVNSLITDNLVRADGGQAGHYFSNVEFYGGGAIENSTLSMGPQPFWPTYNVHNGGADYAVSLKNSVFRREPLALSQAVNCDPGSVGFVSGGGNVADDNSCWTTPVQGDLQIDNGDWQLAQRFPYHWMPYGNSPVVDRLSAPCWISENDGAGGVLPTLLDYDLRGNARDDNKCDAGAIEGRVSFGYLPWTYKALPPP
ncbi:MAG: hypothetical protein ACOX2L_03720 [Anaerolineae bacterium]|jgi:CSLREA domain-containing protein|nr:hypothetical protein [Chloroflexota bacterium]